MAKKVHVDDWPYYCPICEPEKRLSMIDKGNMTTVLHDTAKNMGHRTRLWEMVKSMLARWLGVGTPTTGEKKDPPMGRENEGSRSPEKFLSAKNCKTTSPRVSGKSLSNKRVR